ncbi:phytanoyl-CoA dioxygenase family protein [Streptomyces sp. PTM05]|uniref:Phytanoyl-CoA dioxygenase family protein n=1 Tax=Streptantibioticus parmotrematis TaxID=2873249 RepID=A0ABS7QLB0_9ACTN|nr:phytanoyl-CoA dioxygenase family protein [Streptantibioticus parmotrematis]MBY8883728.1 phytanoyl-CoA dioxygenase family protein [Streptantibioticus parmotrematis]
MSLTQLTQRQIDEYHENGFLMLDSLLDSTEVELLRDAFRRDCEVPGPHLVAEQDGSRVRAVYASHHRQREFAALIRDSRVLTPVRQLLTDDVYVYQFKINAKPAFGGEKWAWHQDFLAWRIADGLPAPRQVNIGVYLDAVTEFNGPVIFLPGSHRGGLVREDRAAGARSEQHLDPDDISLTADQLASYADRFGMVSPKGPAGSVVLFSPEIVHGSAPNMSPFPRRLLIATYNDCANLPQGPREPRPEYVVCRDSEPLAPLEGPLSGALTGVSA